MTDREFNAAVTMRDAEVALESLMFASRAILHEGF